MRQVVLNIPDSKFKYFIKLMKEFNIVLNEIPDSTASNPLSEKRKISRGLKNALKEVEKAEKGKVKLQSAKDFLNEF